MLLFYIDPHIHDVYLSLIVLRLVSHFCVCDATKAVTRIHNIGKTIDKPVFLCTWRRDTTVSFDNNA